MGNKQITAQKRTPCVSTRHLSLGRYDNHYPNRKMPAPQLSHRFLLDSRVTAAETAMSWPEQLQGPCG